MRVGLITPGCGGDPIIDPHGAIRTLKTTYGRAKLLDHALTVVGAVGGSGTSRHESIRVALGIVYHLADEAVLDTLLSQRTHLSASPAAHANVLSHLENLIAALCRVFDCDRPPGIAPLDLQDEHWLFSGLR